jgi:nitroimidazol reductase NimA-like FMN-containing flavoprotein (pyridoxamine 5'-phosphate oxidase superfamily)
MEPYHLRRHDKAMSDISELARVLTSTRFVTLSMCRDNEPYAVVLNHGYDPQQSCLYFHCAPSGKKVDFIDSNRRVWGIAFEDLGYRVGHCDHCFFSVMFGGEVEWVTNLEAKRHALEIMIRQQEPDPESVIAQQLDPGRIESVTIGCVRITEMTGKLSAPEDA